MNKTHTVKLIDGQFTPDEATRVLLSLLNDKIKHHSIEVFSFEERNGKRETRSKERIEELKTSIDEIKSLLKTAKKTSKTLMIKSEIEICFLD